MPQRPGPQPPGCGAELEQVDDRPDLLARWCAVAQAQARLISGDPEAALGRVRAPGRRRRVRRRAGTGRCRQRPTSRSAGRARWPSCSPRAGTGPAVPGPAVEARVLLAVAADRQHRDSAALAAMTEAIDLAQPEGLRRPFLDAGPALAALIRRHRHVTSRHLDFTDPPAAHRRPGGRPASVHPAPEQLTEREMIVLRYLPTMLKAAEIATGPLRDGQHREIASAGDLPQARCHHPPGRGRPGPRPEPAVAPRSRGRPGSTIPWGHSSQCHGRRPARATPAGLAPFIRQPTVPSGDPLLFAGANGHLLGVDDRRRCSASERRVSPPTSSRASRSVLADPAPGWPSELRQQRSEVFRPRTDGRRLCRAGRGLLLHRQTWRYGGRAWPWQIGHTRRLHS